MTVPLGASWGHQAEPDMAPSLPGRPGLTSDTTVQTHAPPNTPGCHEVGGFSPAQEEEGRRVGGALAGE